MGETDPPGNVEPPQIPSSALIKSEFGGLYHSLEVILPRRTVVYPERIIDGSRLK